MSDNPNFPSTGLNREKQGRKYCVGKRGPRKHPLDEYRRKPGMCPRRPNNLHNLLHGIPVLVIASEVTQVLELELQSRDFSRANPSLVICVSDTLSQT